MTQYFKDIGPQIMPRESGQFADGPNEGGGGGRVLDQIVKSSCKFALVRSHGDCWIWKFALALKIIEKNFHNGKKKMMETAPLGTASNFKKKQTVIKENCANWWSIAILLDLIYSIQNFGRNSLLKTQLKMLQRNVALVHWLLLQLQLQNICPSALLGFYYPCGLHN